MMSQTKQLMLFFSFTILLHPSKMAANQFQSPRYFMQHHESTSCMDTGQDGHLREAKSFLPLQVDLSKKGSIDDHIIDLVQYINDTENYFTTSSCSGRISVFSELAGQRKKHCEWLYVTHGTAGAEEVLSSMRSCQGSAVLKFEPFVLHVQCKDLENGQQMLKTALISGFKNSGIVIGKKANVIVAVRSTQSLEVPLVHNGELMVSDQYIKFLVSVANKKMEENQTRIDRFFTNLRDMCEPDGSLTKQKAGQGARQKRTDTRQDKLPVNTATNGTSQSSSATEQCTDEDLMDSLISFYGDVP